MTETKPNILLTMTDQQRGDCLGVEGHPHLKTPHLDELATAGVRFSHAYSACPVCIPARRTLMTGQKPASHGVLANYDTWLKGPTLPEVLSRAGYQTHLVGKLHLWPKRKLYGFNSADWSDGPYPGEDIGDYEDFLRDHGVNYSDACLAHGAALNSFVGRPWHLDEQLHFSNWCADRALKFLQRRDPTLPFFLKVSFFHPHTPLTPPEFYFRRYMDMDLQPLPVGDWARIYDSPPHGLPINSDRVMFDRDTLRHYLAGYYGCINHIDDQIGRILWRLDDPTGKKDWDISDNTMVIFISDHGFMLGEHQWNKKTHAFEGSARVPFLIRFPKSWGIVRGQVRQEVVELMDIMPTILEMAGVEIPTAVDGKSVLPLIRNQGVQWREYIHGECAQHKGRSGGMQYLTDGKWKYIWYPASGEEQLFHLEEDPGEMHECARHPNYSGELDRWRSIMVRELENRPEGFTDGQKLLTLGKPTPFYLPGFERPKIVM
jgi:arylsulfatase